MKNIHVLPTDKPSRVFYYNSHLGLARYIVKKNDGVNTQHIYITNDEEIKEGDWYWLEKIGKRGSESGAYKSAGLKASKLNTLASNCKKVILTTDQDLIKDGVQAIDDEFLEWFVKNPSCEFAHLGFTSIIGDLETKRTYKIIIPKEEQKQNLIDMMQDDEKLGLYDESLEEAKDTAWNIYEHVEGHLYSTSFKNGFEAGAKWQAERMYSEEVVNEMFDTLKRNAVNNVATITNIDLFISSWKRELKKK